MKDTSDIIKQELSSVVSTSRTKITKLTLASDVRIGDDNDNLSLN